MKIVKITDKEYFKSEGLNASALKEFAKSPAHYQAYINQETRKESDAFRIGSQAHKYILEEKELNIKPACDRRKKEGKEIFAQFQASLDYSTDYVDDSEMEAIKQMKSNVAAHAIAKDIINPDWAEKAAFVTCPQTGLHLKCKYDCLPDTGNIIYDLKTSEDASPEKFRWSIKNFKYDLQACHYLYVAQLLGLDMHHFVFVVVEKSAPYGVSTIAISSESLHYAQQRYFDLLSEFSLCEQRNDFTRCYPEEIIPINL
jgi:exodeoxyribonuclease VIII